MQYRVHIDVALGWRENLIAFAVFSNEQLASHLDIIIGWHALLDFGDADMQPGLSIRLYSSAFNHLNRFATQALPHNSILTALYHVPIKRSIQSAHGLCGVVRKSVHVSSYAACPSSSGTRFSRMIKFLYGTDCL